MELNLQYFGGRGSGGGKGSGGGSRGLSLLRLLLQKR